MALPTPPGSNIRQTPPPPPGPVHQKPNVAPPPVAASAQGLPAHILQGTQAAAQYVVICSIYPMALESIPFAHGGRGRQIYRIEAGSLESPAYLQVFNTYTMVQNKYQDSEANQLVPERIDARQLATTDLVGYWADHMMNGQVGKIGVFICAGDQATPEELAAAKANQEAYFKEQMRRADEWWFGGREGRFQLTEARRAARWLKDTDSKRHPWFSDVGFDSTRICPKCAEQVATNSHYCKACQTSVAQYLLDRERPIPQDWPAVAEEMAYLQRKGAPASA